MRTKPESEADEDREVWSVCGQLKYLSTGERAVLRRMVLTRSFQADGVVETIVRRAGIMLDPEDDTAFEMWRLLAHAAAVIAGTAGRTAHAGKRPLGRSLSDAGMKSGAINRLLTARGLALPDQIRRVAYILARSGDAIPTNMVELRNLVSSDATKADLARRSIARAYYAAEDKKDREKAK